MPVVNVSSKGQILIPKKIRERYGVKPGHKVQLLEKDNSIVIRPVPDDPIEAACGFLNGDFSLTADLIEEHKRELKNERANRTR